MKRVISFSLWGDSPTYNIGAIKNAEIAANFYPNFECWFYIHTPTVPESTIQTLQTMSNTKIILKDGDLNTCKPMCWRYEAIDDPEVELMMSRDTDTRILLREKMAVDEWLQSGKTFHIMRDHPHHQNPNTKIMGGMFGTKKIPGINWTNLCNNISQTHHRDYDQEMLNNHIYPLIINSLIVHSSFVIYGGENGFRFPLAYDSDCHFVGEYVYADETLSQYHTDELRRAI
jgi:hypothetical protein